MTRSWRFSTLADRHRALGSKLEDWSGMGTAWSYAADADAEYVAIRTKAGLMDVSGLKKVHITGPHAAHSVAHRLADTACCNALGRTSDHLAAVVHDNRANDRFRGIQPQRERGAWRLFHAAHSAPSSGKACILDLSSGSGIASPPPPQKSSRLRRFRSFCNPRSSGAEITSTPLVSAGGNWRSSR